MIVYLDTSALVKMFVPEDGSDLVEELRLQASALSTSRIAYVEASAAIRRRRREKHLSQRDYLQARRLLADQWADFAVMDMNERRAGDLAAKHHLRGLDAIHLDAALSVRAYAKDPSLIFCTFDARQARAARAEQFLLVPKPDSMRKTT